MGSISNLGELTFSGPSNSPSSVLAPAAPPAYAAEDQVHLASVPLTVQAELGLEDKEPPNLQEVLGDAIRNLRAAATQSADPIEAAYFSGLADRFERLEESGASAPSATAQSTAA
jgi:hypothetical protein